MQSVHILTTILVVLHTPCSAGGSRMMSQLQAANLESQHLAEELSQLLARIESNNGDIEVEESVVQEIVERIQEIGEATEEDNLIRLSETVKQKRREEELLQESINKLDILKADLEGINVVDKVNRKMEELLKYSDVTEEYDEDPEDMGPKLDRIKDNVEHFVELFK